MQSDSNSSSTGSNSGDVAPTSVSPKPGSGVYLGSKLVNMHFYGIVSDIATPNAVSATMELMGGDATLSLDALVGPQGRDGEPANIVKIQYDSNISDPSELPTNLTDEPADVGMAWWIGSQAYIWTGTRYVIRQIGCPGQPGPVPNIDFSVDLISLEDQQKGQLSYVEVNGTASNPSVRMHIAAPQGPRGLNATIRDATDYTEPDPPGIQTGDTLVWNGKKFQPGSVSPALPRFYTISESAFINTITLAKQQVAASITIPIQEHDYWAYVTGILRVGGLQVDLTPVTIEIEVRVDDPNNGTLVARGSSIPGQPAYIMPQFSSPSNPTIAINPDSNACVFNGSAQHTFYVALANGGTIGAYSFSRDYAGLNILIIPKLG